jgi:hypothetical protein
MKKSSLILCMAAGLFASLALATPSQAGSTLVTTDLTWSITGKHSPTATDLSIEYTAVDPISKLTLVSETTNSGATVTLTEPHANTIDINFSKPTSSGMFVFTFDTSAAAGTVGAVFGPMSGVAHTPVSGQNVVLHVSSVPEPASLALLGIGMTGFLAFRRFFKKTSVA